MKSAFTFYLIIFATYTIHAQSLIPDRVFKNVFMLKHGNKYGTSFFALIDHKMYLVTARHIFPKDKLNKSPINFEIMQNEKWMTYTGEYLIHSNPNVDIAVIDLKYANKGFSPVKHGEKKDWFFTQNCYFLGFPHFLKILDETGSLNHGHPLPFTRKAIISGSVKENGVDIIYLDGHNNEGFSGGPVLIMNPPGSEREMTVIGVISGYLSETITRTIKADTVKSVANSGLTRIAPFEYVLGIIQGK